MYRIENLRRWVDQFEELKSTGIRILADIESELAALPGIEIIENLETKLDFRFFDQQIQLIIEIPKGCVSTKKAQIIPYINGQIPGKNFDPVEYESEVKIWIRNADVDIDKSVKYYIELIYSWILKEIKIVPIGEYPLTSIR